MMTFAYTKRHLLTANIPFFFKSYKKATLDLSPSHQKSTGMMFFLRFFTHAKSFTYFCKP